MGVLDYVYHLLGIYVYPGIMRMYVYAYTPRVYYVYGCAPGVQVVIQNSQTELQANHIPLRKVRALPNLKHNLLL